MVFFDSLERFVYLHNLFWISLKDLFGKMGRLFFLSLGVAVGTCALVFLLCLHSGLKKVILDEIIQKLPFNQLKIRPVSQKPKSLMEFTFKQKDESLNLTRDKLDIVSQFEGVKDIWPERTLNFPIIFTLKEVKVGMFTVPDITMPTTIFGIHPDLIQSNPEFAKKFKYDPDPNTEIPILCSTKLFEMMNDTSLAQGKVGDLLSSIVNESTFLNKPLELGVGFSTQDEKRIQDSFERAKNREDRIRNTEIAGMAKFLRKQFSDAFSEGYELDRPWLKRRGRIIGFTDEVPIVGLSVPLPYVEEWLKIRAEYELDQYVGGVLVPKKALSEDPKERNSQLSAIKDQIDWVGPLPGVLEQRFIVENPSRIRLVDDPFQPAPISTLFQSGETPLSLQKPQWKYLETQKQVQQLFWEYTLDFPAALCLPEGEDNFYIPTDLHGVDAEILGDQAELFEYRKTGNDPVPAVVSPKFFSRLKELGLDLKHPERYAQFSDLNALQQKKIYIVLAYDPEKKAEMKEELIGFQQEQTLSKPQFIFRELQIKGVSDRVSDIGFTVPSAFIERAYRWKYPHIKTEQYKFSGISLWTQDLDPQDKKSIVQLEKSVLGSFQLSVNEENSKLLKWVHPNQLSLRKSYWSPRTFEDFFQIKNSSLQLRGGSFTDFDFLDAMQQIYLERKTNFPVQMELAFSQKESLLPVTLVGIHPEQFQDTALQKQFSKKREETDFIPVVLSPLLLEKLQHFQMIPSDSPWASVLQSAQTVIGTELILTIGASGKISATPREKNTLPPTPEYQKENKNIQRVPFCWKAKIVGVSSEASPLGFSIPAKVVEELLRWYYPVKVYENYSGVTVLTHNPENTASVAKQIREHPALKLDILTGTETAELLTTLTTYLKNATFLIGFILFLVAAVSIFNGLTLSVLEQSKKIGIYRAVGAKRSDIVFIFMVESIAVGLLGGSLGIGAGVTAIYYVDQFMIATVPEFAYKNVKIWDTSTGRELETFNGQPGPIHALSISPDGSFLATGSTSSSIKIWDLRSKTEVRTLVPKNHPVSGLVFSKDGKILASSSYKKDIKLWDVDSGKEIKTFSGPTAEIHTIALSPENNLLAAGTFGGEIWVWDLEKEKVLYQWDSGAPVYSVLFSPKERLLAVAGESGQIQLWSLEKGKIEKTLEKHQKAIHAISFSPQGTFLASASLDHTVKFWEVSSGTLLHTFTEHSDVVWSVAFSPEGTWLASAGADKSVKLRDVSFILKEETDPQKVKLDKKEAFLPKETRNFLGHINSVYTIGFFANGRFMVTGSDDFTTFFQKEWDYFFYALLFGTLISVIASLGPSSRAAHITPADVLRDI